MLRKEHSLITARNGRFFECESIQRHANDHQCALTKTVFSSTKLYPGFHLNKTFFRGEEKEEELSSKKDPPDHLKTFFLSTWTLRAVWSSVYNSLVRQQSH